MFVTFNPRFFLSGLSGTHPRQHQVNTAVRRHGDLSVVWMPEMSLWRCHLRRRRPPLSPVCLEADEGAKGSVGGGGRGVNTSGMRLLDGPAVICI